MEKGLLPLERAEATGEVWREEEPESALAYLQSIYKNPMQPEHTRMRAASLALPFETPKLAVTGYVNEAGTFAEALDRAIQRSQERHVTLELSAERANGDGAAEPPAEEERG